MPQPKPKNQHRNTDASGSGRQIPLIEHLMSKHGGFSRPDLVANNVGLIDFLMRNPNATPAELDAHVAQMSQERADLPNVVYYALFADKVKIGTSRNVDLRMTAIPCERLLATEPGTYQLERFRHRQFKEYHYLREWYHYRGAIVDHVEALAATAA